MSDNLLATKLHIPPLHGNLVNRANLVARLNEGITRGCCLTLISAPAGYGKSTLVSEWQAQAKLPVAWLSLERGENTPARFWNYLVAALNTLPQIQKANIDETIIQSLRTSQPGSMEAPLAELINRLSASGQPVCLVLDDLQTLSDSQIHQDLVYLIEHLPHAACSLYLVVSSRMDPPWPLARWRARSELNELRAADLRFRYEETSQFLQKALPLDLSPKEKAALQSRTEGWIAGLQMAVISMQGRLKAQGPEGLSYFIETFSGSNRFILDYLMDEVLSQQSEQIREFLRATSILEQLTAPLCDALIETPGSQTVLDQLERANMFIIPLDDDRCWYRYHHLFAEFLRKQLKQFQPGWISQLHQRASVWYAENRMPADAVRHSLAGGDIARVNQMLSGNALVMVDHVELLDVLRHFKELPTNEISSNPWLCVAYAWAKAYADPSVEMEDLLQQAEHGLNDARQDPMKDKLTSHLAAIRAYMSWMKGDAEQALEFTQRALNNSLEEDWTVRTHLLNIQGLAWQYQGDLAAATRTFTAALTCGEKSGRIHEVLYTISNLAYVHLLQSRLHEAFSLCQMASDRAKGSSGSLERMPVLAYAHATRSIILLEWNDLGPAVAASRQGLALAEQWGQTDALHFALTCLSQVLIAAGHADEAFAVNQRAMQLARTISPWYAHISAENEIVLNLAKGDVPTAEKKVAEYGPIFAEDKNNVHLHMKVFLLYHQNRFPDVVETLDGSLGGIKQKGRERLWLRLLPFLVLALWALDREEKALQVLKQCLAAAESEGYVRIFVEKGAPMATLLKIAASRGINPEYVSKLLDAFPLSGESCEPRKPAPAASRSPVAKLVEPLSERELEVLRLLNSHLAVPEIAREMLVAPSTLRTHVRNIYLKLDVHGRLEALQKARDLGLL